MDKSETKTVYSYDSVGLLIGAHTLDYTDRSPISGRWQIPGNMTEEAPLTAKDGYNVYFNDGAWEYVEIPKVVEPEAPKTVEPTNKTPTMEERVAALEVCNLANMGVQS